MTKTRDFDEHVVLFANFGARVAQLPPASWDRLRVRCAAFNGPEFRALVERSLLAARPMELFVPAPGDVFRAIAGVSRVVQIGLAFAFEVASEFDTDEPKTPIAARRRTASTGNVRTDTYIDADWLIECGLAPFQQTDRGVVTAVRAAGQAVLRHDWLASVDFAAAYAYVESEIPYSEIDPPTA